MSQNELEILGYAESILNALLQEAQLNDAKRRFAGLRKPSKTTIGIFQSLSDLRVKRKNLSAEA
jgi:hypothetical protein